MWSLDLLRSGMTKSIFLIVYEKGLTYIVWAFLDLENLEVDKGSEWFKNVWNILKYYQISDKFRTIWFWNI